MIWTARSSMAVARSTETKGSIRDETRAVRRVRVRSRRTMWAECVEGPSSAGREGRGATNSAAAREGWKALQG